MGEESSIEIQVNVGVNKVVLEAQAFQSESLLESAHVPFNGQSPPSIQT